MHTDRVDQFEAARGLARLFAVEVATSLNLVGQVCDEVMNKAQQEAFRQNGDPSRKELPELRIPKFLENGQNGAHPQGQANGQQH